MVVFAFDSPIDILLEPALKALNPSEPITILELPE
jgi:hypothetical protein